MRPSPVVLKMLAEDDVARLFAAENVAVLQHGFEHVAVAPPALLSTWPPAFLMAWWRPRLLIDGGDQRLIRLKLPRLLDQLAGRR